MKAPGWHAEKNEGASVPEHIDFLQCCIIPADVSMNLWRVLHNFAKNALLEPRPVARRYPAAG
jgi:hypothetical protein